MEEAGRKDSAPDAGEQVAVFSLHDELFGLGISVINEIIEVAPLNAVPRAPVFIGGAMNYHGRIVAVLGLSSFFGLPSHERGALSRVIVLVPSGYSIGFLVDSISEITCLPAGADRENPMEGEAFKSRYVKRVAAIGDNLVNILDVEKMLADIEDYFKEDDIEH